MRNSTCGVERLPRAAALRPGADVRQRKTDYGTVVFHWLMVIALTAAFVTGLRIATETPERTWINQFDFLIPYERVWTTHMQAAVVLAGVSVAYVVYLIRSGLVRRVQFDRMRLRGLLRPGATRGGAINVLLYWLFFSTMAALIVTGALMYFGYSAGTDVLMVHWYASWIIPLFAGLHVLTHYAVGGVSQLLRICRPAGLITPPPPLDAAASAFGLSDTARDRRSCRSRADAGAAVAVAIAQQRARMMPICVISRLVTPSISCYKIVNVH